VPNQLTSEFSVMTSSECLGSSLNVTTCSSLNVSALNASSMIFTSCNVAQIDDIYPLTLAYDTTLTIEGINSIFLFL
jgi:hypothetical protein